MDTGVSINPFKSNLQFGYILNDTPTLLQSLQSIYYVLLLLVYSDRITEMNKCHAQTLNGAFNVKSLVVAVKNKDPA